MSLTPLRCKACKTILQEPPVIVGEDPEMRLSKAVVLILQHFDQHAQKEAQDRNPATNKPHLAAMQNSVMPALMTAQTWLKMGHFELPDYLQAARDQARRSIHGATFKRRMSDEDVQKLAEHLNTSVIGLTNLRDYYEESGQYAPEKKPEPTLVTP